MELSYRAFSHLATSSSRVLTRERVFLTGSTGLTGWKDASLFVFIILSILSILSGFFLQGAAVPVTQSLAQTS
jgi:hypothetical protein